LFYNLDKILPNLGRVMHSLVLEQECLTKVRKKSYFTLKN
jgi:hypothetical protein